MNLVISLPGVPATPVERTMMVRADKWPIPGAVLPIEVDLDKPSRMRVLWDEVPSGRNRGAAAAQQLAAQMNEGRAATAFRGFAAPAVPDAPTTAPATEHSGAPSVPQVPPGAYVVSSSTTINGQPAEIAAVEQMIGMDLNGDGVVGPPPAG